MGIDDPFNPAANDEASKPRMMVKIIVLGSSNVGKTSLMRRFTQGTFTDRRVATTGADYLSKRLRLNGQDCVLQIWDTAGQERFHQGTLGSAFYRGSDACLLVYDVTTPKTFEQIEKWRDELLERIDFPDTFPTVVVGNKCDATTHQDSVDKEAVLHWCRQRGIGHIETSARDGSGVDAAMEAIAMLAIDNKRRRAQHLPEPSDRRPIRLQSSEQLGGMYTRRSTNSERCCGGGGGFEY
jgi:Ras-related protein Rab-7A